MADTTPLVVRVPEPLLAAVTERAVELDVTTTAYVTAQLMSNLGGTAVPERPVHDPVRTYVVPTNVAAAVAARAEELGTTRSEVIRQALRMAVEASPERST